jgi:hypothetical protein
MLKHYEMGLMHPYSSRALQMLPRAWQKALWFGRFQFEKQNKQSTFLDNIANCLV